MTMNIINLIINGKKTINQPAYYMNATHKTRGVRRNLPMTSVADSRIQNPRIPIDRFQRLHDCVRK